MDFCERIKFLRISTSSHRYSVCWYKGTNELETLLIFFTFPKNQNSLWILSNFGRKIFKAGAYCIKKPSGSVFSVTDPLNVFKKLKYSEMIAKLKNPRIMKMKDYIDLLLRILTFTYSNFYIYTFFLGSFLRFQSKKVNFYDCSRGLKIKQKPLIFSKMLQTTFLKASDPLWKGGAACLNSSQLTDV